MKEYTITDLLNEHQKITLTCCYDNFQKKADLSHLREICQSLGPKYEYNFRLDSDQALWESCNKYIRDLFNETLK